MRAVQCRSYQLILCQAIRRLIGDVRRRVRMRVCRFALAILLLANLVTLLPLASADLPDPTWLVGIYDESDGDTVVWLIDTIARTIHPKDGIEGKPDLDVNRLLGSAEALHRPSVSAPAIISLIASPSRAPPLCECDGVPSPLPVPLLGSRKLTSAGQVFDRSHANHNDRKARVEP